MRRFIKSVSALCIITIIAAPWASLADILVVEVVNIQSPGELHIAIYDDAKAFQGDKGEKGGPAEGIIDGVIQEVSGEAVSFRFELPEGRYAIGVFHDANRNNRLDTGLFGIPKEQFGFSNNAKGRFGPPSFEAASFVVSGSATQSITLSD